jgi:hypothetical protein
MHKAAHFYAVVLINKAPRSLLRGALFWCLHKKVIRFMITDSKQEAISKTLIFQNSFK